MRTEQQCVEAVSDQVRHGIHRCGWDETDFAECVNRALDMTLTDEEAMRYPDVGMLVKMTIIL